VQNNHIDYTINFADKTDFEHTIKELPIDIKYHQYLEKVTY